MEETQAFDDSQDSSSAVRRPLESVSVEGVNGRGGHVGNCDYNRDRDYDYDNDCDYDRDCGCAYNECGSDRDTYCRGYTGRDGRNFGVSYISTLVYSVLLYMWVSLLFP